MFDEKSKMRLCERTQVHQAELSIDILKVDSDGSANTDSGHERSTRSSRSPPMDAPPSTSTSMDTEISVPSLVNLIGPMKEWLEAASSVSTMNTLESPFPFFSFPEHGTLSNRQVDYMVAQFKSSIKSFVLDNQTTFIHPLLYQETVPGLYQDVLTLCSLYLHQTPRNRDCIFRILDCKVTALVKASPSLLSSVEDNLLALQALILYQIIRLFDGDIRQRVNAERHLELLDSWTLRLQQNYFQALETPGTEPVYDHWVLIESIRRTTMVSVVLRGLYAVMKDGYCELVPLLCTLPVSNTGRLWKTAEMNWWEQTSSQEVVTYLEFLEKWNAGNVSRVDEYEKLLLVFCRHANGTGDFQPG